MTTQEPDFRSHADPAPQDDEVIDELDPTQDAYDDGQDNADLSAELERLRTEKQALYEKLLQAQADFVNSRRRLENDAEQRVSLAVGRFVRNLLPIADNLERAVGLDPLNTDAAGVIGGVRGTLDGLLQLLKTEGVEPITPQIGTPFDPATHEALMQEPAGPDAPADTTTVTRVLQTGYTHRGRTLRPAQVAVSSPA